MERSNNSWMIKMMGETMGGYREPDYNPRKERRKKWVKRGLAYAILMLVILITGRKLFNFIMAWRAEGALQTASSYSAIYNSFERTGALQQRLKEKREFMKTPFCFNGWNQYTEGNMMATMSMGASAAQHVILDNLGGGNNSITGSESVSHVDQEGFGSTTNTQVQGIAEGDQVLTDGKYLYVLHYDQDYYEDEDSGTEGVIYILQKEGQGVREVSRISIPLEFILQEIDLEQEMEFFVQKDTLILVGTVSNEDTKTKTIFYDISDRTNPVKKSDTTQTGAYLSSRISDGYLYLISQYSDFYADSAEETECYIPKVGEETLEPEKIYMQRDLYQSGYIVFSSYQLKGKGECRKTDTCAVVGGGGEIYMGRENIYVMNCVVPKYFDSTDRTGITKLHYSKGKLEGKCHKIVAGTMGDSFAIDEKDGKLRICMTVRHYSTTWEAKKIEIPIQWTLYGRNTPQMKMVLGEVSDSMDNALYILDEELQKVGELKSLAEDEQIYSARFADDMLYLVTYRRIDPLFQVDLSDPEEPKILDALKLPGFSDYLHYFDEGLLVGLGKAEDETRIKLSMYDVQKPGEIKVVQDEVMKEHFSDGLAEYKRILVQPDRNVIGYGVEGAYGEVYYLWAYNRVKGFQCILADKREVYHEDYWSRGLFMGEDFLVVRSGKRNCEISIYNPDNWKKTGRQIF